ncbi:uncharacterized protein LOC133287988 [Gastrolobium bilobum]|uniref:uncharacterized protein LOC133287988 n=1 Tax=Gastrolobium bilobum TaxID=150636 RepID=UPI002AAF443D|nr:uncharacterized protein LOC133287988 [Gastrolobium bilobum]
MGIQPVQLTPQPAAWEIAIEKLAQTTTSLKNQEAYIKNLEIHIGKLAKQMVERPPGTFSSDTIINPKEQCNVITTKSGIVIQPVEKPIVAPSSKNDSEKEKSAEEKADNPIDEKLQINILIIEALENMPSYAKFMKILLSRKHKLKEEMETVALTAKCSAIIQKKVPPKPKDPGSFSIACTIGNVHVGRALCDLGASINLMPLSFAKSLGITELKPTLLSLQLTDRSIKKPEGVVEDVLVKVNDYIFPVDFVVLDMKEDSKVPLILGRPFLATTRVLIDVEQGKLVFRVNGEQFTVNMFEAMKYPKEKGNCFQIDVIDEAIAAFADEINSAPSIEGSFARILQSSNLLNEVLLEEVVKDIDVISDDYEF